MIKYLIQKRGFGSKTWHTAGPRPPVGVMSFCGIWFADGAYNVSRVSPGEHALIRGSVCRTCERLAG